jgi:drug/metabolite transporter (DMT)-like permease
MTFYNGLKLVSASSAVAILSLGSVITTILKLVFLDAVVSFSQITGMMLLVVGILVFTVTIENLKKFYSIFSTA